MLWQVCVPGGVVVVPEQGVVGVVAGEAELIALLRHEEVGNVRRLR